jgi:hypothetical protein
MASALCFRCDWHGETDAAACPDCAAPLYRPAARVTRAGTSPREDESTFGDDGFHEHRALRLRQRTPFAVATVVTVVVATVSFLWVRSNTPQAKVTSTLTGTLVYAEDLGDGSSRLWRWDLSADTVSPGPRVDAPIELVDARGADGGWIGVTSRLSRTELQASVLRFLDPTERAAPLVRGDMISWGPDGAGVVAAARSPVEGDCHRRVSVTYVQLVPRQRDRQFADDLCGDVLSVGRGGVVTYFTLQRGNEVRIAYVSVGLVRTVLREFAMIGASPAGDLLVVPVSALPPNPIAPLGARIDRDRPPTGVFGTALFFRGLDTTPIPYGRGGDRFQIDRIMAWTPDGLTALVAGRLGDRTGLFEIDGGPGGGLRAPRFVGPIEGLTWATYADDGTAFVSSDAGISIVRGGRLVPLEVPATGSEPSGPIVWVP